MTETAQPNAFYVQYIPTKRERFWRWAGFRFHLGKTEDENTPWTGWMKTETMMYLSIADRLRLLVSGKLKLSHAVDMDTPSPSKMFTRFDWQILPPGEKP